MPKNLVRIGVPPFLNTKPLIAALERETGSHIFELSELPPSSLSPLMVKGDLDISLLPAADIFENPEFQVLNGVCISSSGKVGSVVVFSGRPMAEIRTVAVDSASSSSAMMLKTVLEIFNGARPVYEKRKYGKDFFRGVDAGLVIGNAGLELCASPPEDLPFRFDMGEVWSDKTGLPFVYAVFAARPGFAADAAFEALLLSKKRGIQMLREISKTGSAVLGLSAEMCGDYLENRIKYELGLEEKRGLLEFGRLISHLKKRDDSPVINFHSYKEESND